MSAVFYPLSLIAKLKSSKADRTLQDSFEDGSTSARQLWLPQNFKRKFELTHAPLTPDEFRYLRSFYSARGTFDSFWFRDNVNRDGNAQCRFTQPFLPEYVGRGRPLTMQFEEIAPVRALPEQEDILAAAGSSPVLFWDANRELYYLHAGTAYTPESANTWDTMRAFPGTWSASPMVLGNTTAQGQGYQFDGTRYAKSASIAAMNGKTEATIFCHALAQNDGTNKVAVIYGTSTSSGRCLGLYVTPTGFWYGFIGGGFGTTNSFSNGAVWRSVALTVSGTTASLYSNGSLVGTETLGASLSLLTDVFTIGALNDGTSPLAANSLVGNALLFSSALSGPQIAALHNLFASQQGLATV